jgi:hypothetical protein
MRRQRPEALRKDRIDCDGEAVLTIVGLRERPEESEQLEEETEGPALTEAALR